MLLTPVTYNSASYVMDGRRGGGISRNTYMEVECYIIWLKVINLASNALSNDWEVLRGIRSCVNYTSCPIIRDRDLQTPGYTMGQNIPD